MTVTTATAVTTVSYTHLDVYKRQGGDIAKKAQAFALKETEKETEESTYQAMEALIHLSLIHI